MFARLVVVLCCIFCPVDIICNFVVHCATHECSYMYIIPKYILFLIIIGSV